MIQHLALALEHETAIEDRSLAVKLSREYEVWPPQDEGGAVNTPAERA